MESSANCAKRDATMRCHRSEIVAPSRSSRKHFAGSRKSLSNHVGGAPHHACGARMRSRDSCPLQGGMALSPRSTARASVTGLWDEPKAVCARAAAHSRPAHCRGAPPRSAKETGVDQRSETSRRQFQSPARAVHLLRSAHVAHRSKRFREAVWPIPETILPPSSYDRASTFKMRGRRQ